ncbi:MFS transporter [Kocuria rosea]|uniref:MFS transporter n=1 Tax=Kocuria rosea TaxID=1275 RepID=UPI000D659A8E|nr:MFS transporter [Kocuria rosea]PWF79799.1 MFS transporter [Kocuria rosea]STX03426.1 Inner membrane transport protein YeaN [Kocuria rosea]
MSTLPIPPRALPWVVVGIVLVALSLRGPIIAPTPVITQIQSELGLSAATAGLLTGLPVLLFALVTPLASKLIGRFGPEAAVLACLSGVLAGTVIRSAGPTAVVLAGTVVIGTAIAVGNIVVPVIIRRDVSWRRIPTVTAAYTAALNVGSMITALGTAPLAAAVGWRWALVAWGALTVVALVFWLVVARRRTGTPPAASTPAEPSTATGTLRQARGTTQIRRIGWWLTLAFCGQAISYYSVTAWLPTLLADTRGLSLAASGAGASLFQVAAIAGALGVPLLAARAPSWVPVTVIGALWITLPVGLLIAPEGYLVWSAVGGVAQGGGFTTIFSIVARIVRTDAEAAATSARIQGAGYLAATVGPPLVGALNAGTGGWTVPLLVVLGATLVFLAGGLLAVAETRPTHKSPSVEASQ